uniref:Uncharacterized protein n=1 Tax=Utricularia reniformis TaxID=192314 RepID=A0A1Y0AZ65_9LAMI|nr:hypothetical protein AEK19_MT0192 [Utricularia reniformis]ART30472.1 hypothetical protein AEK19_MT0192 [Utricularia reniformis]
MKVIVVFCVCLDRIVGIPSIWKALVRAQFVTRLLV